MLFEEKIIHLQRIFVFMKNDIVRLKNMIDFLVNEGNIRGLGKGGVQMIRKEDINYGQKNIKNQ
ncbi:hypothetical protein LDK11_07920 [Fusobacterium nucleatum]